MKLEPKTYPKIMKLLKKRNIKLHAFLKEGTPISFNNNIFRIEFNKNKKFHKNKVEQQKEYLEELFNKFYEDDIKLDFMIKGEFIEKMLDIFGGEIIKVDEEVLK